MVLINLFAGKKWRLRDTIGKGVSEWDEWRK